MKSELLFLFLALAVHNTVGQVVESIKDDEKEPKRITLKLSQPDFLLDVNDLMDTARKLMKFERYNKALKCYNRAIKMSASNASWYELRGICHLAMESHEDAFNDFKKALEVAKETNMPESSILKATDLKKLGKKFADSYSTHSEALWCYERAVERDSTDSSLLGHRGILYFHMGKLSEALKDLKTALKLMKPNEEIDWKVADLVPLGNKFLEKQHPEEALWCYDTAINLQPEVAENYSTRGKYYLNARKFEEAASDFFKAIANRKWISDQDRENVLVALFNFGQFTEELQLGTIFTAGMGNLRTAKTSQTFYEMYKKQTSAEARWIHTQTCNTKEYLLYPACAFLTTLQYGPRKEKGCPCLIYRVDGGCPSFAVILPPNSCKLHTAPSGALYKVGRDVHNDHKIPQKGQQNNVPSPTVLEAVVLDDSTLAKLADRFKDAKKCNEALQYYNEAIRKKANHEHFEKRGSCNLELKNYNEALTDFREATKINKSSQRAWYYLVETLFQAGQRDEALKELQEMDDTMLVKLASDYYGIKGCQNAVHLYNEAINKNSSKALYYSLRAGCHLELDDLQSAIADLRTVIQKVPNNVDDRLRLIEALLLSPKHGKADAKAEMSALDHSQLMAAGYRLLRKGKFQEAIVCYTESINKNPKVADYYAKRGSCHYKLEDFPDAITDLKKSLELEPSNSPTQVDLCEVFIKTGDIDEATAILNVLEEKFRPYYQHPYRIRMEEAREKLGVKRRKLSSE